ncbi:hypothetical protein PFICI_07944 [Pestalotiopsis fici W106-1]|uniref:Short chain dehydrogenase n=1 Tax=Pestalotiopsis fici (strain W106-1 / CGMCC3.15140) TaxID=1229662 RepID=W3X2W1_PESFW|nr:uncharacterized protein PFICI_07944 [Pestalotiopsis fici W106-1]ETS80415.1 hypothetical protein PFICI_07944 [Pestalotiopsis fici W106-1]
MSVYVITGVSKGIGFEFLKQLSEDKNNLFVGIVRDKVGTEKKIAAELGERPNVHILQGDLTKYATLKAAAAEVAKIVGDRGIDYLVANGGLVPSFDAYGPVSALADKVEETDAGAAETFATNVTGNLHLFNLLVPLVKKGKAKKVITISSGVGDVDLTNQCEIDVGPIYAASKAAMNIIVAKFNAEYKKDGILFLAISPGLVEVGRYADATPEQMAGMMGFVGKLAVYAPDFKGPITPEESVKAVRSVWEKASIEDGYGGAFISHLGNKQWV